MKASGLGYLRLEIGSSSGSGPVFSTRSSPSKEQLGDRRNHERGTAPAPGTSHGRGLRRRPPQQLNYVPFHYQGRDYMKAMLHDLDPLAGSQHLCALFLMQPAVAIANPLLAP